MVDMVGKYLSTEELINMEDYISAYANIQSEVENRVSIDYILRIWDQEKSKYLFQLFNDNLILQKTIEYKKDYQELLDDLYDNGKFYRFQFVKELNALAYNRGGNFYYLRDLILEKNLIENKYTGIDFIIELPNGKTLSISKGCKVMRVLQKVANAFNLHGFEEFRISHSQALNQKIVNGELCISIHPLDYMTMSDNDCGWSSCMSWMETGDYRRGTVEMMNSSMVVVAYLNSDTPMRIPDGGIWNNKKWRQLFVVTKEAIFGIKGYPYQNKYLEEEVATWLRQLAIENLGWSYYDTMDDWKSDRRVETPHGPRYIRPCTDTMYNDCGLEMRGYFSESTPTNCEIMYSGPSECLCCGGLYKDDISFIDSSSLVCDKCEEGIYYCWSCGETFRSDEDDLFTVDGRLLCYVCYDDLADSCTECGAVHLSCNMESVHIALDEQHICKYRHISLCNECLQSYNIKTIINEGETIYYILLDDLDDGYLYTMLGYYNKDQFAKEIKSNARDGITFFSV